jgi:ribonuclease-3
MKETNFEEFEKRIGYSFSDKNTLKLAFTHSSYSNEHKKGIHENNERLEFLGDAVLDMVVSEYMYRIFPDMPEGELTKLRAGVVCEESLAHLARCLEIGKYLLLGKGEEATGGRNRNSILADAFEAIIGAVCIDGGKDAAEKYILSFMKAEIQQAKNHYHTLDCKTHLQEVIQKNSKMPLSYRIIDEMGPDHNKLFVAEVCHGDTVLGKGKGRSKKEAEQCAANDALKHMNL